LVQPFLFDENLSGEKKDHCVRDFRLKNHYLCKKRKNEEAIQYHRQLQPCPTLHG
jgi:hypothetical protein